MVVFVRIRHTAATLAAKREGFTRPAPPIWVIRVWLHAWFGGSYAEQFCQVKSGLNGRLRSVRGILPATLAAQQAGFPRVIVPLRQAREPKLVQGIEVYGIA